MLLDCTWYLEEADGQFFVCDESSDARVCRPDFKSAMMEAVDLYAQDLLDQMALGLLPAGRIMRA